MKISSFTIYFFALKQNMRDMIPQPTKAKPDEWVIVPRPTSGVTIQPKANITAPTRAEAAPALSCSSLSAITVELVKHKPMQVRSEAANTSYAQNGPSASMTKHSQRAEMRMPMAPDRVLCIGVLNFTETADPKPMRIALKPKIMLYAKAE